MDHTDLLTMDEDAFVSKLRALEAAFRDGEAAYFWDDETGAHTVDVFAAGSRSAAEHQDLREFAATLQQPMIFAFEGAPDGIVSDWGEEHADGLGEVALRRVGLLRQQLQVALQEWVHRFSDLGSTFGNVVVSTVYSSDVHDFRAILRMNSFDVSGPRRAPIMSSRNSITAVLSRAELRRIVEYLSQAVETMPTFEQLEDFEEEMEEGES